LPDRDPNSPPPEIVDLVDMQRTTSVDLHALAHEIGIEKTSGMPRKQLIFRIVKKKIHDGAEVHGKGTLEVLPDGYGFLRNPHYDYLASPDDIYVSPAQIRRFKLIAGATITGILRPPKNAEKYFAMARLETIEGDPAVEGRKPVPFENLTPTFPDRRIFLETAGDEMSGRICNLVTPIGFGQRMLIVAPPRTGKTMLLQCIANAIETNHPEAHVIVLLIDERPEEVTNFRRGCPSAEVISSTFDESPDRHVQITEMVANKAKRMVESGKDVIVLLDSITRMARAHNVVAKHSGRIMTGGIDVKALEIPRRFFCSARAIEEGGSLTLIGTALIDTGSRMDDVIFEEFKGTGNSELYLDRRLVDRRIWHAIDITRSGTRKEELLLEPMEFKLVTTLRRVISDMPPTEAMDMLMGKMKTTNSNAEFLMSMMPK